MASSIPQIRALAVQYLNAAVTQVFGPTSNGFEPANFGYAHFHTGVDLVFNTSGGPASDRSAGDGIAIRTASSGKVICAHSCSGGASQGCQNDAGTGCGHSTCTSGFGNCVVVQSPNGYTYLYGHLANLQSFLYSGGKPAGAGLQVGDLVHVGDIIGHMGSTGNSTGPHLHFEIKNAAGVPVDPGRTVQAIIYTIYHSLGYGAGYLAGQNPNVLPDPTTPPSPGGQYSPVGPLPAINPDISGGDKRFTFGRPSTPGASDPSLTDPTTGPEAPPDVSGSSGPQPVSGYDPTAGQPGAVSTTLPQALSALTQPGGPLGALFGGGRNPDLASVTTGVDSGTGSCSEAILVVGVAGAGALLVLIGLLAVTREQEAQTIVQPVVAPVKDAADTGASLVGAAAKAP